MVVEWCVDATRDRIGQAELVQGARGLAAGPTVLPLAATRDLI
jgi:hypothetical protein